MADVKLIRKQIKNVLSEVKEEFVSSTLAAGVEKALIEKLNSRCDAVDAYVKTELEKQDKRAKDVQGFMIQIVKGTVQASLHDFDLTIEAIVSVLSDSGVVVPDFDAKVKEKKVVIKKSRDDAAGERLIAETAARAAATPSADEATETTSQA